MNSVKFTSDQLIIEPIGLDKVWAFKSRLSIPLKHISEMVVESMDQLKADGKWNHIKIRTLGLGLPHKKSGTFQGNVSKSFVNISGKRDILFIKLDGEAYDYLFLTVDDPSKVVNIFQKMRQPS
ncbi:hypothetical protein YK48G_23310 [Lentilactobacillus fungorum]|uniref:Bacterial Pleckstrin homology domain-containing protein n=1 Tax=Lentilactobacillus fungorum TaxID=2201250 RepID=A0ABQ3W401_9LACO|nr:hypothetical protein [Lentilactobacillus fungorum]GHP14906.1 hypothetical protein YK48G_23310 [Lentilactobacillus fungorum]